MNQAAVQSLLLAIEQAAALLGFSEETHKAPAEAVRWLCRKRRIRYIKVGRRLMFREQWLLDFLERESVAPIESKTVE